MTGKRIPEKKLKVVVLLYFLLLFLLGALLFDDYGFSWDESIQRLHGMVSLDYVNEKLGNLFWESKITEHDLNTYEHGYYGVLFSMVCYGLEQIFGLESIREIYLLRHFSVFFLFWIGAIFFYKLINLRFQNKYFALAGVTLLLLSPRIFAHAFFNPKDMVLLPCVIISAFFLVKFLKKPSVSNVVFLSLTTAIVINVRIVGILIPALTYLFLLLDVLSAKNKKNQIWKIVLLSFLHLLLLIFFTVLFWPYLWEDPINRFLFTFEIMSRFEWGGMIYYFGNLIKATEIPWHYSLVWIAITTPVLYIVLFLIGLVFIFIQTIKNLGTRRIWKNEKERMDLLFVLLTIGPIGAIIFFNSILYNGWRQLFFVYPWLLLCGISGIIYLNEYLRKTVKSNSYVQIKRVVSILILASVLSTLSFMIRNHPYQYMYFNGMTASNQWRNFELDYWGLSYKQAYEELLKRDNRSVIKVHCATYPGWENFNFLPESQKKRFKYEWDMNRASYYITHYVDEWQMTKFEIKEFPLKQEFFTLKVGMSPAVSVFKLD